MILADKIILFRKKNGWSQEEFAEKMGVSRQSVSKWEGAQSVPELDKLLLMANLFGVSTDYLLKDEMETAEYVEVKEEENEDGIRRVSMEEASRFLALKKETVPKVALGVMLCIFSPIVLIFLEGCVEAGKFGITEALEAGIGLTVLILLVAAAVAIFILCGMKLKDFEYLEKEPIETEYGVAGMAKERKKQLRQSYTVRTTVGICLCVLSSLPVFLSELFGEDPFMEILSFCLLLLMVGVGVFLIVSAAIEKGAVEQLLEEGDYTKKSKRLNRRLSPVVSIYWGLATAIYLFISFYYMNWERSWIVWPVAGVLFAAVWEIARLFLRDKK